MGAIVIIALVLWRVCRHRDREAAGNDIRWPELKADHDMTGAAMQPLPARRTGGAGFDMGDESEGDLEEEEDLSGPNAVPATGATSAHPMPGNHSALDGTTDDVHSDRSTDKYGSQNPAYGVPSSTALSPNAPESYPDGYAEYDQGAPGLARGSSMGASEQLFNAHGASTSVSGYGAAGIGAGAMQGYYEGQGEYGSYDQQQQQYLPVAADGYGSYGASPVPAGMPASLSPGMTMGPGYQQQFMNPQYSAADSTGFADPYGRTH